MRSGGSASPGVRKRALAAARAHLGTPYRHQGSRRGVGCDCLGLVRGVWRELYGEEPEDPGPYTADWSLRAGPDRLLSAALRHLASVPLASAEPGDVVLFAWRAGAPATHCGILDEPLAKACGSPAFPGRSSHSGGQRVIHAYEGAAVVSSPLPPAWERRIVGAFRFPE